MISKTSDKTGSKTGTKTSGKMSEILKANRIKALLERDIFLSTRSIVVTSITLGLLVIAITFVNNISINTGYSTLSTFATFFVFVGFAVTARSFSDMHSKERAYEWFMLPASILEKFLSKLLFTTVGWTLLFLAVYSISSLLGEVLGILAFGHRHPFFNPLHPDVWRVVLDYCIIQSVFLFGAAYFKRNNLVKTVLAVVLFFSVFAILLFLAGRFFFYGFFTDFVYHNGSGQYRFFFDWNTLPAGINRRLVDILRVVYTAVKFIYYALLAPLFWFFTYLRITGKEVRNGV